MAQITRRQNLRMAKSQVDIQTIINVLLFKRNISEDTIELNEFKKLNQKLGKLRAVAYLLDGYWSTVKFTIKTPNDRKTL